MSHQEGSHAEKTYFVSGLERPPFTTHQTKYVFSVSPPKYSQGALMGPLPPSAMVEQHQQHSPPGSPSIPPRGHSSSDAVVRSRTLSRDWQYSDPHKPKPRLARQHSDNDFYDTAPRHHQHHHQGGFRHPSAYETHSDWGDTSSSAPYNTDTLPTLIPQSATSTLNNRAYETNTASSRRFQTLPPRAKITDEVDRSVVETSFQSYEEPEPEPEEIIEEEVISLRPVGQGMHVLEPERPPDGGRLTPGFPIGGGPTSVATTPPFPTSPRMPFVNQGQPRVVQQTQYHTVQNVQQSYSSSSNAQNQGVPPQQLQQVPPSPQQQQLPAIGPPPGMQPTPQMNGQMSDMGTLQSGSTGTLQSNSGTLQSGSTLQGGTLTHGSTMQGGTLPQGATMQMGTLPQGATLQQGQVQQGQMQPMMVPPQMVPPQNMAVQQSTNNNLQNMATSYNNVQSTGGAQPLPGGGMSQYQMDKKVQSQQNYNVAPVPNQPGATMTQQFHQHNQQQNYSYSATGGTQRPPIMTASQQGAPLAAHQQALQYNVDTTDASRGQQQQGFQAVQTEGVAVQQGGMAGMQNMQAMPQMQTMPQMQGMQTGMQNAGMQTGMQTGMQGMQNTGMQNAGMQTAGMQTGIQGMQTANTLQNQQGVVMNGMNPPHQALHVDTSQRMLNANIPSNASGSQMSGMSPTSTLRSQQSTMTQQSGITTPNAMSSVGQSSPYFGQSHHGSLSSLDSMEMSAHTPKFVRDTSKYWYKPHISREEAISFLKDTEPGTFIVRDSNSFPGAFGLALKVAHVPPNVTTKPGDPAGSELVRHFLIETTPKGVKLRGCSNEPVFGSLAALVYQHSITPLALPCKLKLPESDSVDAGQMPSSAAQLLTQGAACNVVYLATIDTESLTGPEAVAKAVKDTFAIAASKTTVVHFKVSSQGITLTDTKRRLFFRRHYPVAMVTYCGMDPEERRWSRPNDDTGMPMNAKVFGFVARKHGNMADNACHLFAELDVEQPATAIVNFINKVMLGTPRKS